MAKSFKINDEAVARRVRKMVDIRTECIRVGTQHYYVFVKKGNSKTGDDCWTVSLIPIADCKNCTGCKNNCYDIRNDCIYPDVLTQRAINSAIHMKEPERFWREIGESIVTNGITELRGNVGGDYGYDDFNAIRDLFKEKDSCDFLFFTKEYEDLNQYITENIDTYPDNFGFPSNVHPIMSRWLGMPCNNPYGVPESHVLWPNGDTTAPEYGAYYCGGNCSDCHMKHEGCWTLKKGESVVFNAH